MSPKLKTPGGAAVLRTGAGPPLKPNVVAAVVTGALSPNLKTPGGAAVLGTGAGPPLKPNEYAPLVLLPAKLSSGGLPAGEAK